jgi:hypothetical protein
MSVLTHRNFVEENDRIDFLNHIDKISNQFKNNKVGPYRRWCKLDTTDHFTNLHHHYLLKISKKLNLTTIKIDSVSGILYSVIQPGGFIHEHKDSNPPYNTGKFINYRFNLMLDRDSDSSYNPIVDTFEYTIGINDAWSFAASEYLHKTNIINGNSRRVVLQYGFLLKLNEYTSVINSS